jgi:hypothetical protein
MKSLIQIPVSSCVGLRKVENDKPIVSGILFIMPKGIYSRKKKETISLCNSCGLFPKYPSQGLCRKCFFEKIHNKWVASRPPKVEIINLPGEEWKDIIEADGYQISSFGRIKSLNYYDESGRHHILKLRESRKGGYLKADLDKYNWRPSVHRLVGIYFVPNPHNYPLVLHKDSNKQNNHKDNLYWGNPSKNRIDYIQHTNSIGLKRTKMPIEKVLSIFNSSKTVQDIALENNVSPSTVWMIKTGYRWSSVTGIKNTDKRKINE